jgi:hypothetical protein
VNVDVRVVVVVVLVVVVRVVVVVGDVTVDDVFIPADILIAIPVGTLIGSEAISIA